MERKLAVTPALLLSMLSHLQMNTFNGVMLWGAMLVAFFGLFRKDNITVGKASAFNPRANLTVGDFVLRQEVLWVRVKHSKVIQYNQRFHWVPLLPLAGNALCPVAAVVNVLKLHTKMGHTVDTPMFMWQSNESFSPMTHDMFVRSFKLLVKACGLNWSEYAGHSFRRGGATFCFNLGVNSELIKLLGDWKSDVYLLYEETTIARRLQLPSAMSAAIMNGCLDHGPRLVK